MQGESSKIELVQFYYRAAATDAEGVKSVQGESSKIKNEKIYRKKREKRLYNLRIMIDRRENGGVGQGWGGCREGPVRPSQL